MAQDQADTSCPHCGAPLTLALDYSLSSQEYVEDCQTCCRPIVISVALNASGGADVTVVPEGG